MVVSGGCRLRGGLASVGVVFVCFGCLLLAVSSGFLVLFPDNVFSGNYFKVTFDPVSSEVNVGGSVNFTGSVDLVRDPSVSLSECYASLKVYVDGQPVESASHVVLLGSSSSFDGFYYVLEFGGAGRHVVDLFFNVMHYSGVPVEQIHAQSVVFVVSEDLVSVGVSCGVGGYVSVSTPYLAVQHIDENSFGEVSFAEFSSVTFRAWPRYNYSFSHWIINNEVVVSENPYVLSLSSSFVVSPVFVDVNGEVLAPTPIVTPSPSPVSTVEPTTSPVLPTTDSTVQPSSGESDVWAAWSVHDVLMGALGALMVVLGSVCMVKSRK